MPRLSEPYLHAKIFRDVNTLYFTSVGWMTYYVVNKWNQKAPITAGKRRKRREAEQKFDPKLIEDTEQKFDPKLIEDLLDMAYNNIVKRLAMDEKEKEKK